MIVDTMTFEEVALYLWRTSFSNTTLDALKRLYIQKQKQYYKKLKQWIRNHSEDEKYIIFNPVTYKGKNDERIVVVHYSNNIKYIDFVLFVKFRYCGRMYVAMKLNNKNGVQFYSWHSLERYAERFLGDKEAEIDDVFIGDMLIYNLQYRETNYTYKDKETLMLVCTDGAFLCERFGDYNVARTFISQTEYFNNQEELDKTAFAELQKYKQEVWGNTLDRN